MKKRYYAVHRGRKDNVIVPTWAECSALVTGYPGAIFKGFYSNQLRQAIKFAEFGRKDKPKIKFAPKIKKKPKKQWGKCLMRKTYRDPKTYALKVNACVWKYICTMTGIDYIESNDESCPF